MPFLRKYNTLLVTGTTAIRIPIIKRAVVDFAVGADWTPATGDVKVFVDAAAVANITNLPTAIASGNGAFWEFILTAAELSCKQVLVVISDAATKAVEDQSFVVETYGNASAMYAADLSLANLPANVTQLLGTAWLTPGTAGTPDVNAKLLGATAQTGRDIGASVLLSSGAGTGQLDFTAGVVKANLAQILGTALTETAGLLAGGFKKFFNIATPAATMDHGILLDTVTTATTASALTANNDKTGYGLSAAAVQAIWDALTSALTTAGSIGKRLADFITGDAFVRLGAPAGASHAADVAAVKVDTTAVKTKTDQLVFTTANQVDATAVTIGASAITAAAIATDAITAAKIAPDAIGASELAADAVTEIQSGLATSAALATVQADTDDIQARLPAALTGAGNIKAEALVIATDAMSAAALKADAVAEIVNGVWDELIAGHLGAGSTGAALNAAGSSGDPWTTPLPGAYGAGTAGKIVADTFAAVDTEVAAILAAVDTEVAAIKAKTDQFVFTIANKVDSSLQAGGDIAAAVANKLADHIIRRTLANVRASANGDAVNKRSLLGAAAKLANRVKVNGSNLDIYEEDDTAVFFSQALTTSPTADPIVEMDTT